MVAAFHGTGGDERDLLPLIERSAPEAGVLSVRGNVTEGGARRFFRRLEVNVFDEEDVRFRAGKLAAFLAAAWDAYGFAGRPLLAVGYSNGANIASALMLLHPETLAGAVLLRPMPPFAEPPEAELEGKEVLVIGGEEDAIVPPQGAKAIAEQLSERGAETTLIWHSGGHELGPHDVESIAAFVRGYTGSPR